MKKLLFVLRDLNMGGTETSLINLLNVIDYDKYQVDLLLENKEGILLDKVNSKVNIIDYNLSNNKVFFVRKIVNYLKRRRFIKQHTNQYDFTCCYATYSLLGNYLAKKLSNNSCIFIHGDYVLDLREGKKIRDFFNKRRLDEFKYIVFVSNESKERLLDYYPNIKDQAVVFNNFINYDEINKISKEKISEVKAAKQLVYVGRLDEKVKNITKIIDVVRVNKGYYLWIVGDGPDKDFIKEYIRKNNLDNRCLMLGNKINPYPYIKQSDYLMMASKNEGFPMTYLEAVVLETPIISTIDVSDEFISIPNRFGYIVDRDNYVDEVSDIIKKDKLVLEKFDYKKQEKSKIKIIEKMFDGVDK